jgi:glycosyltransferase involved in cell wall biosynthesis
VPNRPACLITGIVSDYRREPFRLLAEAEDVEVIAFQEAGPPVPGLTVHRTSQAGAVRMAGSGRYRAVIASLGGRIALPGSYAAARLRRVPFVLWATIWEHPSTLAHRISRRPTRHIYRHADAVATYGPHVSAHVAHVRQDRDTIFEAPQAVDDAHFGAEVPAAAVAGARERAGAGDGPLVLFVGRLEEEKGVPVLLEAWERAELGPGARLALAGAGPLAGLIHGGAYPGAGVLGRLDRDELPALYAAADALVLPSIRTETFTEPWGLVVNEAMNQSTPVIASDSVGAAAGGLVVHGRNGLVVPAGDAGELARALQRITGDDALRARLGAAARSDVAAYSPAAWADGMARALAAAGAASEAGTTS